MKTNKQSHFAVFAMLAATVTISQAELFTYTDGNLILGFQAASGTGSTQNVFFDMGPATGFRDNGSQGELGNIGATLSSVYGNNWYEREDLYFGVIANLNQQPNPSPGVVYGTRSPVNGDPSRTFYVSTPATNPGTGALISTNTYAPASLGSAGTILSGLEKVLKHDTDGTGWISGSPDPLSQGLQKTSDGAGVLEQTLTQHATAWNNSWSVRNPTPGAAFDTFTGGIQQHFGKGGTATYVDVQRVLSTNTGAVPTGVVGGGTYETTIAISSTGAITAMTPSAPTSAYTTWMDEFTTQLPDAADREAAADPDHDGIANLMEFVLNGNPSVSSPSIQPTMSASGANFVFSFTRRADSIAEVAQVFESSTDLVDWTTRAPITIPAEPGFYGSFTVGDVTGSVPNQVQSITINILKGSDTKLFGRLKAE